MYFVQPNQHTMKHVYRLTFLCALLICFHLSPAQNAFYDSKRIVTLIKSGNYDDILPILMSYTKEGEKFPWAKMSKKYPDHIATIKRASDAKYQALLTNKLNKEKESINSKIDSAMKTKDNTRALDEFKRLFDNYYIKLSSIAKLRGFQNKLGGEDAVSPFTKELEQEFIKEFDQDSTTLKIFRADASRSSGDTLGSSNSAVRAQTIDDMVWLYNLNHLWKAIDDSSAILISMSELLIDPIVRKIMISDSSQKSQYEANKNILKSMSDQISDRAIYYNDAISKSSSGSGGVPSQAEMIDALAVYLAKRVKQEVAISFIEKLGTYIRDENLLSNLFPATLRLLNNQDAYSQPNFGTSWHIALSEDFVKIPENLINCIPTRYNVLQDYLIDGVQIAKLVQLKYSLVEGVNRLHDDTVLKTLPLKYSNEVLYMINHELYDTNSNRGYWLHADNLRSLSRDQLEWMYILLDIRYGETLNKGLNSKWDKEIWKEEFFVKKVYPYRNWIIRVLLQLNHFENDIKQLNQGGEKRTENSASAMLSGYWKFQNELMDVVMDTNFVKLPPQTTKWIGFTRGIFALYSSIESKNYSLVVDQLLKVLSVLDIDQQVNLQSVLYNRKFAVALRQKEKGTRDTILNLFDRLNDKYDRLSHGRDLKRLLSIYDSIQVELKTVDQKYALKYQGSASDLRDKIVHMMRNNMIPNLDTILGTSETMNKLLSDNKDLHKSVWSKIQRGKNELKDLIANKGIVDSSMKIYESLKLILRENRLDNPKYSRLNPVCIKHFVEEKVFNLEAAQYNVFLNSVQSRSQYKKVLTTLSFLSDVMQAGNSMALSKVIEAYAMPPSSYKVKRHSRFSINIDAMVGGYGGVEYIKDLSGNPTYTAVAGLSAPIGVSLNWGKRSSFSSKRKSELSNGEYGFVSRRGSYKTLKGYNLSVLLSVIDIGAVVSYRISGSKGNGLPADAKWSQVFSPGLTGIVGIKGLPLCIGSGLRFTPNLRSLDTGLQRNALRLDFGIYFDLPMANVYYR